jgi:pyruvate dehydrogenase E2 component (dihydrolipoamide acetyltransferase)
MIEFKLPDVGEGIHEAEIVNWLVKVGDAVKQDQPILEIQTDKALVEIPSPVAGTVAEIRVQQGQIAHMGDVIIVFETKEGDNISNLTNGAQAIPAPASPAPISTATATKPSLAGPGQRVLAAPAVRKLARELGLDLAQVPGTGPAGRVLLSDVKKFTEQPSPAPEPAPVPTPKPAAPEPPAAEPKSRPAPAGPTGAESIDREPLQGLRRRIAERMEEAWRVPHVTTFDEVEVAKLVKLRRALKPLAEQQGIRLTYLPFIIKAVTQALHEFPIFNASLDMAGQEVLLRRYYHLGVATAIPEGLVVPVVRHADQLSLRQLSQELTRLADLARERRLTSSELSGSTFTLTNYGSYGSRQGTPIINPPEVAILGMGRIEETPVAIKGKLKIRPTLPLALSFDHRLIDGAAAAQFLGRIKQLLTNPKQLILEL